MDNDNRPKLDQSPGKLKSLSYSGRLAALLCLPAILGTGVLSSLQLLLDWGWVAEGSASLAAVRWLYLTLPLPAFVLAAYVGPALIPVAALLAALAWRSGERSVRWWAVGSLGLAVCAVTFFYLVVQWWDLSFLP